VILPSTNACLTGADASSKRSVFVTATRLFSHARRNRFVRQLEFPGEMLYASASSMVVQVGALDVFNERQFKELLVRRVTDHNRNGFQSALRAACKRRSRDQSVQSAFAG